MKAFALLSLPTAVPCTFRGSDFFGDCFFAGSVDCITTMVASALDRSVQLNFLRHSSRSPRQRQGDCYFFDRTRLDCRDDGRSCPNSAGFPRGLRQLLRAEITEQQAVWCGSHSIVFRQGVNVVESSHGR